MKAVLGVLGMLAGSVTATADAATFAASVRWQPSVGSTVAGYHVYQRPATGTYGPPIEAGMPSAASDGTLAFRVAGLDATTDYAFCVTAYAGSGLESPRSNEIVLTHPVSSTTSTTTSTTRPPTTSTTTSSSTSTTRIIATSTTSTTPTSTTSTTPTSTTSTTPTSTTVVTSTTTSTLPLPAAVCFGDGGFDTGAGFGANRKRAAVFTAATSGSVTRLWVYLTAGPTNDLGIQGLIYADAGNQPGALLAAGTPMTVAAGSAGGWYALSFPAPVAVTAGTPYWLGDVTDGASASYGTRVTGGRDANDNAFVNGPADPWGSHDGVRGSLAIFAECGRSTCAPGQCPTTSTTSTSSTTTSSASSTSSTAQPSTTSTLARPSTTSTTSTTLPGVPAPVCFGDSTVDQGTAFGAGRKRAGRFTATNGGSVARLWIYLTAGPTVDLGLRGVIYADAAGLPGGLLAGGTPTTIPAGSPPGWYALPFASPVAVGAGTSYWLGDLSDSSTGSYGFRATGARDANDDSFVDGPADPWGSHDAVRGSLTIFAECGSRAADVVSSAPAARACTASRCDDGDPCTIDACTTLGCRHDALRGVAGLRCMVTTGLRIEQCIDLPPRIQHGWDRAARLLDGADESRPRMTRRLVHKAARVLNRAAAVAERLERHHALDPACAGALDRVLRHRAAELGQRPPW